MTCVWAATSRLAGWRLRAGGWRPIRPRSAAARGRQSFRVVSQDGNHAPLEVHASNSADGNAVCLPAPAAGSASARLRPSHADVVGAGEAALNVRNDGGTQEIMLGSTRMAAWSRP